MLWTGSNLSIFEWQANAWVSDEALWGGGKRAFPFFPDTLLSSATHAVTSLIIPLMDSLLAG